MTISQTPEVLWEPDDPHEALSGAVASLRVDGLEPSPFGMTTMERVADGEIDTDEAVAALIAHHRA